MPVPKRKTSKARRDKRHSTRFLRPKAISSCQNCDAPINSHVACESCGFYKGKKVLRTKIERILKRGEKQSALQAKQKPAQGEHEGHERQEEK